MILKPCVRFERNSLLKQLWHIQTELFEMFIEVIRNRPMKLAIETVDLMVAGRTLLHIQGWDKSMVDYFARLVDEKNEVRNYHKEA